MNSQQCEQVSTPGYRWKKLERKRWLEQRVPTPSEPPASVRPAELPSCPAQPDPVNNWPASLPVLHGVEVWVGFILPPFGTRPQQLPRILESCCSYLTDAIVTWPTSLTESKLDTCKTQNFIYLALDTERGGDVGVGDGVGTSKVSVFLGSTSCLSKLNNSTSVGRLLPPTYWKI